MCRVTVVFINGDCETSVVGFETAGGACGALNEHKPEDFVEIGSIVCKAGDVSRVIVEDLDITKKFVKELHADLEVNENDPEL